ncbi:hypothetical protein ESY86_14210 [Subsaximicrobium wynnwilliamsii]|uniref:Uncharacterized protein n=1 Tax=Subsaximicrobium wynnwilliamsii TaxID=291179 RepID=A0A5C6ZEN9_9FLAO|nr:hypothetical protein [Subsaximicrobium wynnwilliamsii]TXD82397.1 hypothetical protein ESY87_13800 [Subsaximicrobium wynnwilliamsii]TXD88039.1 hypothetical protein ESY86_14210 [Subsaximicrobium wynnwilliamsii]TXE02099.1 hypothetical protein ESY88_13730 [Subsaximicrobium wynnwilliamsii]
MKFTFQNENKTTHTWKSISEKQVETLPLLVFMNDKFKKSFDCLHPEKKSGASMAFTPTLYISYKVWCMSCDVG